MRHDPRQTQFLNVVTRDEATARFQQHLKLEPLGRETLPLGAALGRILAEDIRSDVDVPGFDRSNVDGFAVQATATHGAMEESARTMELNDEVLSPGIAPRQPVTAERATTIATGGIVPRGADAVIMVEYTELATDGRRLEVTRAAALARALQYDVVVLSGGTSKGAGDLSYRVVSELRDPGVVAHGVALKPGKPICLAVTSGKPVVILPGFPTSAIFTFQEFVAPVIRAYAGVPRDRRPTVSAMLPMRVNSERGRTEYLLVGLVRGHAGLAAYPMGKGSGSVTAFSGADGFITIDQHTEIVDAGSAVSVQLLGQKLEPADLVIIGSHCVGLDLLIGELLRKGFRAKSLYVGSMGGLAAAKRGECDIAGIHLLDPATGEYNRPLLSSDLALVPGYGRMQGI